MKKHAYRYTICNQPDEEIFIKQCKAIESRVPITKKHDLIVDVDESKFQRYDFADGEIIVLNDYEVGYVGVESDADLTVYFKKSS